MRSSLRRHLAINLLWIVLLQLDLALCEHKWPCQESPHVVSDEVTARNVELCANLSADKAEPTCEDAVDGTPKGKECKLADTQEGPHHAGREQDLQNDLPADSIGLGTKRPTSGCQ